MGWDSESKVKEMREEGARYLIAKQVNNIDENSGENSSIGKPIGFLLFQFTWEETMSDDDQEIEVIYWYNFVFLFFGNGVNFFFNRTPSINILNSVTKSN